MGRGFYEGEYKRLRTAMQISKSRQRDRGGNITRSDAANFHGFSHPSIVSFPSFLFFPVTFLIIFIITAHSNHSVVYSQFRICRDHSCCDYVISDKRIFSGSSNLKYFCTSLRVEVVYFISFSTCCPKAGKSIKEYEMK